MKRYSEEEPDFDYYRVRVNQWRIPLGRGYYVIPGWNRQRAIHAWMICAHRLGLPKDMARLIGEYVFKTELNEWQTCGL